MSGLFNGQPVYNENDSCACAWLRRLIAAGHITRGRVVEGDIHELSSATIGKAKRFHAFAGIGLWDYALDLAGWPAEVPVWTGSCPCQPFSVVGRKEGSGDARHLWPVWFTLIRECQPPVIFGEQVASPDGRLWLRAVQADLEALGYAFAGADLCAAGVGAPHLRQRLYFMAYLPSRIGVMANNAVNGWRKGGSYCRQGDDGAPAQGSGERLADDSSYSGFWANVDWVICRDGKARPTEPGTFPLAHGNSGRVAVVRSGEQAGAEEAHWYNRAGALRGIGNAIVPQVAAVFIGEALRSMHDNLWGGSRAMGGC